MSSRIILNEGLGGGSTPQTIRIVNCFNFEKSPIGFLIFLIYYYCVLFSVFLCFLFLDVFTNCLSWVILTKKYSKFSLFHIYIRLKKKKNHQFWQRTTGTSVSKSCFCLDFVLRAHMVLKRLNYQHIRIFLTPIWHRNSRPPSALFSGRSDGRVPVPFPCRPRKSHASTAAFTP